MQTILVANPKGGSGKTTIATNVAGWLAGKRQNVALEDRDPQQSASEWLARRPVLFPRIASYPPSGKMRGGKGTEPQWLIVDSPAALHGDELRDAVRGADVMLVPLTPSAFDMGATRHFFAAIHDYKSVKRGAVAIAVVANRVDHRTRSASLLDTFLEEFSFPVIGHLRDTQVYVHCARDGASVFDLPRSRGEQDWEQWKPVTRWIARQAPKGG